MTKPQALNKYNIVRNQWERDIVTAKKHQQEVQQQRHQELTALCEEADVVLDGRRNRKRKETV